MLQYFVCTLLLSTLQVLAASQIKIAIIKFMVVVLSRCSYHERTHHGRVWSSNFMGHEGGKYLCLFVGGRKSSIVSNHFDTIPIPQLSQHCTGWWSAAVIVLCPSYLECHHSWGHSGYLRPLAPLKPSCVACNWEILWWSSCLHNAHPPMPHCTLLEGS